MASYIGNKPVAGEFKRLDSIAGQFNGVLTSFSLNFNSVSVSAGDASQLIVSLDGVVQEPLGAYTLGVGGSTIVFATAPVAGSTCHIVQLGGVGGTITGTLTDNIVTTAKIGAGAVTSDRITIDDHISFPNNTNLKFGDGDEGQIYYNSSNDTFYIYNYSANGGTIIQNNSATGGIALQPVPNENAVYCSPNGSVQLYHNGGSSSKLQTTSNGINVTGTVAANGLSISGGGVTIATSGTNTLTSNGTLRFDIDHDNDATDNRYHFTKNAGAGTVLEAREDGDVKFYNAAGTDVKLFWDASAESLSVGVTGSSTDRRFQISSTGPQTATTQYGIVANPTMSNDVTGSIYNIYSQANVASGASLTNLYSVYVGAAGLNSSTVTNVYGIYQAGTSDRNYFAGKIGIGGTNAISTNPQWDLVVGSNNSVGTNGQIFVDATVNGTGDGITIDGDGRSTGDGSLFLIIDKDNTVAMDVGTDGITDIKQIKQVDLTPINTSISDTAVGVFVYDTRKDSDGGAWRKRTQHTSWYNETLNTATRGSRREFPAVAVMIVENQKLRIYDGDDPDMPMWMVFDCTAEDMLGGANASGGSWLTAASAVNGNMAISSVSGYAPYLFNVNFISEIGYMWHYSDGRYRYNGNISTRNDADGMYVEDSSASIVFLYCRDVAMTVLPNAPIDSVTGLPVPTIAVATQQGVSIIKDNGNVVSGFTAAVNHPILTVDFTENKEVVTQTGNQGAGHSLAFLGIDGTELEQYAYQTRPQISEYVTKVVPTKGNEVAFNKCGGLDHSVNNVLNGLSRLDHVPNGSVALTNHLNSMMNYTTVDYNTGWMHGDIKIATLSDTDDTNVTGAELVTNSDFSSASDWTLGAGWSISGGKLRKSSNDNVSATQTITGLVIGKTYQISVTVDTGSSSGYIYAQNNYNSTQLTTAGTHTRTFIATSTSHAVGVTGITANGLIVDSFSVRIAEVDRSVRGGSNGQSLKVFGTITKTPVATGSDIVAYSGFSSANYLETQLTGFATSASDPICIIAWVKTTVDSSQIVYGLNVSNVYNAGSNAIGLTIGWSPGHWVERGQNVGYQENDVKFGQWQQMVIIRDSAKTKTYLDGKFTKEVLAGNALDATSILRVGCALDGTGAFSGSVALLRISNTVPSTEQIAKMYKDEKVLFQENAKATLYGSSNTVTALAYDEDTELLHAGTSAGRSVFQGLSRVDNTTDAVGGAIDVSNGMVAEE